MRTTGGTWKWVSAALVGLIFAACFVLAGCSPSPTKKPGDKKKADTPVVKPETKPQESIKFDEPAKKDEPAFKLDEPMKKDEPAVKPEEKKDEPVVKPDEKMDEPVVKPDEKMDEPVVKPEEKKEEPKEEAKKDEPAKEPEKKTDEPAVKAQPPVKTDELAKVDAPAVVKAGTPPAPPPVSKYAPAEDLVSQMDMYIEELDKTLASEQEFKDAGEKVARDANTLIVIALGLGLHDQDNKYKKAAPAVMKAAQKLAEVKEFGAAKEGLADVKKAASGDVKAEGELKWEKVASLPALMKQVPLIHNKLKRNVKGERFESKAKDSQGQSAVIAIIGQGSLADTTQAKSDEQVAQWYKFSAQMRDVAGAVNAGVHGKDQSATAESMVRLQKSCDECHEVFHKAALLDKEQ